MKAIGRALAFIFLILGTYEVRAVGIESRSASTTEEVRSQKKWSLSLNLEGSGNLQELEQESALSFTPLFAYAFNKQISMSVRGALAQDFTPESKFRYDDIFILGAYQFSPIFSSIQPQTSLQITAPISKVSRDASLISALKVKGSLSKTFLKRITLQPNAAVTWNIHEFETSVGAFDGQRPNIQYTLTPGVVLTGTLGPLTLSTSWSYLLQTTYQGARRHKYTNSTELTYSPTNKISLTVGLSNEGSTTRNQGLNNNVTLFDRRQTQVYGSTSVNF